MSDSLQGGRVPLTVLFTTRNEEINIERSLRSVHGFADQIFVIDSESEDRTVEIARRYADEVHNLAYEHGRIIPWIFQWGLDHLPIRNEWVLILEADQALPPELRQEIAALLSRPEIQQNGFYIRRRQIFRGKAIRFGGYGSKYLLKLFRRGHAELDPVEQDTRVYVRGAVGRLRAPLEEWNRKEDAILFYLQKHLRYAEAFAQEERERRRSGLPWKLTPRLLGTPDERVLWLKSRWYRMPLYLRPVLYFLYRYFFLFGILDGKNGFVFHFLQAFWFRFIVDVRLEELARGAGRERRPGMTARRLLPVLTALAVALSLNALASDFFIDDAYISFHYADNLVRDGSLYYNRGEQGPFGYTNPLYVFLLAALRRVSAGAVSCEMIARGLGVLSLAAILTTVLWVIVERTERRGWGVTLVYSGLAVLFFLLFPGMLPNFYSGLETGLFTLCLFAMILSVKAGSPRLELPLSAALAAALSLRMDGGFLVLPLLGVYAIAALRESNPRRLFRLGYSFLAAGAVYLIQIAIAGFWLPLSLYQKKSVFSLQTVGSYEAYLLLVTAPLIALTYRRTSRYLTGLAVLYPLFVSFFYGFFMYWMFKRYVFPAAFALAAALLLSFFKLDLRWRRRECLLGLYILVAFPAGVLEGWSWVSGYRVAMLNTRRIAAAMNAAALPAGRRTIAAQDAGYLAYRTDWRLLDLLGLTTPEILTEDVAGAVGRLSPTVLILNAPNGSRPEELKLRSRLGRPDSPVPAEYRFVKHLPFTSRYWWPELDYGYFIFVNQNANPGLVDGLASISVDAEKEIGWQRYGFRLLRSLVAPGT